MALGLMGGQSFLSAGQNMLSSAAQTRSQMEKKQQYPGQEKTVGGGLLAGASMAAAGAQLGTAIPPIGPGIGAAGGAILGLASYLFS